MKKFLRNLIILALFFIAIYYVTPSFKEGRCNQYEDFLKIKFNGIVVKREIDHHEHSYPFIYIRDLKNNSVLKLNLSLDTSNFFETIKLNDTLSKNVNDAWIYKKNNGVYQKFKVLDFGCSEK